MQCENSVSHLGAYFLQGERKSVRCTGVAKWEVFVNPPRGDDDGKVRLCDHCNKFDYQTFKRQEIGR